MQRLFFITILALVCLLPVPVVAENMESPRYKLEFKKVPPEMVNSTIPFTTQLNDEQVLELQKNGFVITDQIPEPITFRLSETNLSIDTLSPNTPYLLSSDLQVEAQKVGHLLQLRAQKPLTALNGEVLPHLQCPDCSVSAATAWPSDAYGLGYTLSGSSTEIPADFQNGNYFRVLPDASLKQNFMRILSTSSQQNRSDSSSKHRVNFKIVPRSDQTQIYTTIIDMRVLPQF